MANGRDEKIVTKFSPKHFLLSREMQKTHESRGQEQPPAGPPRDIPDLKDPSDILGRGVRESLDMGIKYLLPQKRMKIEEIYGKGSADWIANNLDKFTPEEKYQLHDMFYQFPSKVDGRMIKHTGEQIRVTSPIIGRQG